MNYEQLRGVFGTPVNNISDNGFTVNYGGYNIKGEGVGTLPLVDLTFYAVFPTDPTNDIAQLGIALESKYGKIPTSYNKGYLSVLIDYKERESTDVGAIIGDVIVFLREQDARPCDIPVQAPVMAGAAGSAQNSGFAPYTAVPVGNAQNSGFAQYNSAPTVSSERFALGVLGALVGTALGMIVWIIISCLGYISVIGGACIAGGAMFGYLIAAGTMSKKGMAVSAIMLIAGVAAASYISMGISIMDALDVGFADAIGSVPIFLEYSEVKSAFISDLVIGYIFALIAAISMYVKYFERR